MRWKVLAVLGLVLPTLWLRANMAAEPLPPRAQWIPQDAVIVMEVSEPKALLDMALGDKVKSLVTSSPLWKQQVSQPGFQQFHQVIRYVEATLNTDWETALRKLVGGGMTSATMPDGASVLIVDAQDENMLQKLNEFAVAAAKAEAAKRGTAAAAPKEHRGVTVYTLGGVDAHALIGSRLVLANRRAALDAVLDQRANPQGKSVATVPAYQDAQKAAGPSAAFAFVNLEPLKRLPQVQKALDRGENPMAALLFGGIQDALRGANWLAMGLRVEGTTLSLSAVTGGKAVDTSALTGFTWPGPNKGALPNLAVPGRLAAISLYRDLHGFYAAKDKLFPERTSGLIFFENMMGIFFSGRDFTEEVMGQLDPEVRLVVAEQKYDPAIGTPNLKVPSFAAVFRLKDPKKFTEVAEEAWQKALGLINFTRGQKALPGLIIDRPSYGETRFSVAYFSAVSEKDRKNLDMRFNFRPALAQWGDYLIMSSTEGLTKDLIDALKKEKTESVKALVQTHSLVDIDVTQIGSALAANRDAMIRQNMVDKGASRQQAETNIDLLITALKAAGQVTLDMGSRDGQPRARLKVKLNLN
jgi:hypothetical protein